MDEDKREDGSASPHEPEDEGRKLPILTMTDTVFAVSVDALLWIVPSGEHRNNVENFRAVGWSLEELEACTQLLNDLLDHLITLTSWREHPQLAVPMLEALLFTEALAGQSETPGPKV